MRVDIWSGMLFSNLAMFFIILVCAATLFKGGITNIASAAEAELEFDITALDIGADRDERLTFFLKRTGKLFDLIFPGI